MSSLSEPRKKIKLVFSNEEKKKIKGSMWSEEDDISLLKGMIDYEVLKQTNPYADMGKFLDFVKPSLHFNVQRKQLTDRLWRLKNRFLNSSYDPSKPHHAYLLELSKSINAWGHHANMSVDGDKSENVVASYDDQDVEEDNVVVDDVDVDKNAKKGKVVTCDGRNGEKDNVAVDDDVRVDEGLKVVKKKRKLASRDGKNVEEVNVVVDVVIGGLKVVKKKKKGKGVSCDGQNDKEDDVVVEDVDAGKGEQVVNDKKKGKGVTCVGQNDKEDAVFVEDVDAGKGEQVVKDKNKGNVVSRDHQNVEEDTVVVDDLNGGKGSKVVKKKNKGKGVSCDGQNDKEDDVVVEDVGAGKSEQVVKDKNKGNVVTRDDQNVEEDTVAVDELDGDGSKSVQVVKDRNKGKVVISDGQNEEEDRVVAGKSDQVVKDKMGEVVISNGQYVEEVNAVVDDVQSAKKNGKKRVKVLGHENVNRKDLQDFTLVYPELSNMLELEILSRMPQNIRKKCVMDTINFMGREKANELEEKWANIRLMEMELKAKKLDLTSKQINLILEAVRR